MCLEHVDVKTVDGFYIVETKGREEIQILDKNIAVKKWCEVVSKGTGKKWTYLYLREGDWSGKISVNAKLFLRNILKYSIDQIKKIF